MRMELAVKIAVSAGVGLGVCQALGLSYPSYAVLAAATVGDLSWRHAGLLGVLRMSGTVVGATTALLLVKVFGVTPWTVGIGVLLAIGACVLVRSAEAARLSVIVIGVGALDFADQIGPWFGGRLLVTLIGAIVTVVISSLPWPRKVDVTAAALGAACRRHRLLARALPGPGAARAAPPPPVSRVVGQE